MSLNARIPGGGIVQGGIGVGQTVSDSCFVVNSPAESQYNISGSTLAPCRTTNPWSNQLQVKFSGNYPLPWWGLQISGVFQNLAGPNYTANRAYTRTEVLHVWGDVAPADRRPGSASRETGSAANF